MHIAKCRKIQGIVTENFAQFYDHTFENHDKIDYFLGKYNRLKLTQKTSFQRGSDVSKNVPTHFP